MSKGGSNYRLSRKVSCLAKILLVLTLLAAPARSALAYVVCPIPERLTEVSQQAIYLVQPGDTLWSIARDYGIRVDSLMEANQLQSSLITEGQALTIPDSEQEQVNQNCADNSNNHPAEGYVVKAGDTLWGIAQRFGTSVGQLKDINGLRGDLIRPGRRLILPQGASQPVMVQQAALGSRSQAHSYSQEDLMWLARAISAEARGEPFLGQVAVGAVILNRVESPRFPNTIKGVIFEAHGGVYQFSCVQDGSIYQEPSESAIRAAKEALRGVDPTNGSLYFYNPELTSGSNWIRTRPVVKTIANHVFTI